MASKMHIRKHLISSGQPKHGNKFCVLCKQFDGAETTHNTKDCKQHKTTTEKCFKKSSEHMSIHELYMSNQKLTKKLKKLQKKERNIFALMILTLWIWNLIWNDY
eukprot:9947453-Ditylum_brightwellii.AAC.1